MNDSELVSVSWIIFFALFALCAFFFADRERNQEWIERMGAILFVAIILASVGGAMAGKFFSFVLGIPWAAGTSINTAAGVVGIITSWIVFAFSVEWLVGLAVVSFLCGGISLLVTGYVM